MVSAGSRASRALRALMAVFAVAISLSIATTAHAFCGFYVSGSGDNLVNRATRVALMRSGIRTVLTMSNDYEGPPRDFAMVVPVPVVLQQENVRTLPHDVFQHLEQLTAPRLVEYWEQDPCYQPTYEREGRVMNTAAVPAPTAQPSSGSADLGVRIEAQFTVGEYQVVVLSATESTGLETWLRQNNYNIPQGAAEYLAPYVRDQFKFFVARVDIEQVQRRPDGSARLSPLRFHYDSPEFRLPVRLGLLNAPEQQDLLVWVLHPSSRFEVSNYTNAYIPTNLNVADAVRNRFAEFYAGIFDRTIERNGGRAVVTEYSWSAGTCDPCPTPGLDAAELATLGGDVLQAMGETVNPWNMVVTRLHTRYNRATLTEDLIFREAGPIAGGRETALVDNTPEQGVQENSGINNFQARYAIRHPWTGPIACSNPRRGIWGEPPNGVARPAAATAQDLGSIRRTTRLDLASMLVTSVPQLQLPARATLQGNAPQRPWDLPGWVVAVVMSTLLGVAAIRMARMLK